MRTILVAGAVLGLSALACAGAPAAGAGSGSADQLYRSRCSACHRAYPPSSRTAGSWAEVLAKMAPRARLSDAERARILEYLQANASDGPAAAGRR